MISHIVGMSEQTEYERLLAWLNQKTAKHGQKAAVMREAGADTHSSTFYNALKGHVPSADKMIGWLSNLGVRFLLPEEKSCQEGSMELCDTGVQPTRTDDILLFELKQAIPEQILPSVAARAFPHLTKEESRTRLQKILQRKVNMSVGEYYAIASVISDYKPGVYLDQVVTGILTTRSQSLAKQKEHAQRAEDEQLLDLPPVMTLQEPDKQP